MLTVSKYCNIFNSIMNTFTKILVAHKLQFNSSRLTISKCFSKISNSDEASNATLKKAKTPIGKLDSCATPEGRHPYQEKEPLKEYPNNTNPSTGEIGGPRGPEPTRYGDWERKGRVSDF